MREFSEKQKQNKKNRSVYAVLVYDPPPPISLPHSRRPLKEGDAEIFDLRQSAQECHRDKESVVRTYHLENRVQQKQRLKVQRSPFLCCDKRIFFHLVFFHGPNPKSVQPDKK